MLVDLLVWPNFCTIFCMKIIILIYSFFLYTFFFFLFWNRFKSRKGVKEGEKLLHWMTCWPLQGEFKGQYKFYTDLVEKVLHYSREYGGHPKKNLLIVKKALLGDVRFEKKINKELKGSYFQYIFLGVITWLFIFGSQQILHSKFVIEKSSIFIILGTQVLGIFLFQIVCKGIKKRDFFFFEQVYGVLFSFLSLIKVELPIGTILEQSSLEKIYERVPSEWRPLVKELTLVIQRWKTLGGEVKSDVYDILEETHFLRDLAFEKFKEKIQFLRLVFLGVFFLTPYLFYLSVLLNSFLIV